ncbi:MAG TPA: DUF4350 domain-containing protein [Candidatus Lokiarchaeia archaeon]|nr:DUF4350 domain-containing protein [Candidatus Lokiarchaeia archaeon]
MPRTRKSRIVFDLVHENLIDINEPDYSKLKKLLKKLNFEVTVLSRGPIHADTLENVDLLVIGCPVDELILKEEVDAIEDFVRQGGQLLVASEYGGDAVQKTNLNELTKLFGIYFENSVVKSSRFAGSPNAPFITNFAEHEVTRNVLKTLVGGCTSIRTAKNAVGLAFSGTDSWNEIFNPVDFEWTKRPETDLPIAAATQYGSGRVFAIGDVDIFSNDEVYGLKSMDNEQFVINVLRWLTSPTNQEDVLNWVLLQIGHFGDQMTALGKKVENIIETTQLLEERISHLEGKPGHVLRGDSEVRAIHPRGILEQEENRPLEQEHD